jgi:hypothetical protein
MKIKQMAAAALLPATIAGVALSAGGTAHAAGGTSHPAGGTAHAADQHPAHERRWVTVRRGQTLAGIAGAHHVSWEALYATPPNMRLMPKPGDLRAGDHLRIPENPRFRAGQFTIKYAPAMRREHELRAFASDRARPARAKRGHHASTEATTAASTASTGQSLTAGMSAFEQCVAWRESSDTPTDPDGLFGILPSTWAELGYSGTAGQASVALQKVAFNRLYAEYGAQPWAPSDGC